MTQDKGTRDTFCFLAMSGLNRWNRDQESTARGSNDPPNPSQDDQAYHSEDSEYDGRQEYTARKSREFPKDTTLRTPEFRAQEDHHEFCFAFRQECQWYQDKEMVRLLRTRGNSPILGPRACQCLLRSKFSWMQSLGVCFGRSVTSSIHSQGGKLGLLDISLVG